MSRLFEALSDEELKRGLLKIVPRTVASATDNSADATAARVNPNEATQQVEPAQVLPPDSNVVIPAESVSQTMISSERAQLLPPAQIDKEYGSPQAPLLNSSSPDVVAPEATAVGMNAPESTQARKSWVEVPPKHAAPLEVSSVEVNVSPDSRLVAFSNPNSLGAEKFRALVTRLDHLRKQREMKSLQVTSSVINEGKTVVAGNLAVTLAKYSGAKTLMIEGDLHRPTLASLFGLRELPGLSHWWSGNDPEPTQFIYRVNEMPLWILPAGKPCDLPSDILSSVRFAKAFVQLASHFEWIVVDSTPMQPTVDVNLWSRLVDGTLLVVREGIAPVKALKKGLQALDHPKLVGMVINDVTSSDHIGYNDKYYGGRKPAAG